MRNTSQEFGEKGREVRFLEIAEAKLSSNWIQQQKYRLI